LWNPIISSYWNERISKNRKFIKSKATFQSQIEEYDKKLAPLNEQFNKLQTIIESNKEELKTNTEELNILERKDKLLPANKRSSAQQLIELQNKIQKTEITP